MTNDPRHRTSPAMLRKLARSPMIYGDSTEWDHFDIRDVVRRGLPKLDPELLEAKRAKREDGYLRMTARNERLRSSVIPSREDGKGSQVT